MTDKSVGSKTDGPVKKPYETPRLEVYGDIREVTDTVGMTGMMDGGVHSMNRTR